MHSTLLHTGRFSLLLLVAGLFAFRYIDNDDFVKRLLEQFQTYNEQRPTEKVYVHTDRDAYLTGETIWLKGYLVNGTTHAYDTLTRVLYVDLIDPVARRIRLRAQFRATESYAPGQLTLPDSLPTGTYQLRAYTNYMRNFSDAYYFTKTLTVLQAQESDFKAVSALTQSDKPDVQFLPEGGQLVEGLESRVAFKAIDNSGRGIPIEGFILGAKKDTVVGFASTHLGMGNFVMKPEPGDSYTAFVRLPDGKRVSYPMPSVQAQGVVMQVDNLTSKDMIRVFIRHNKAVADPNATFAFAAQVRGLMVQVAKVPLARKASLIQLPKAQFPEGIAQLTLFDETNKPVCERLVFIDKGEQMQVDLKTTKSTYKNREKVDVTISTTVDGKPVSANLSLAAIDARLAPEADSNSATIVSHLLLTSDLTGAIEQPDYYFNPAHTDRWRQLDLLLMTQGWRRFAWSDVLSGTIPAMKYPLETGLSLTGRVVRPNQKDIGGKVKLTFVLTRRDSTNEILSGDTDESGHFGAYGLDFTDTTRVMIQGIKGKSDRDLAISLDQLLTPTVTVLRVPYNPLEFRRDELAEFIRRTKEYQEIERQIRRNGEVLLQSVTVKAKKYEKQDTRTIYSQPDASVKFDATNTAGQFSVLDVLRGRIAGVQVFGSGPTARVQIRAAANFSGAIDPLFLLDGQPVDLQTVSSLSVQDVDKVDVLKGASAALFGSRAAGGVISILTKRGSPDYDPAKEVTPGTLIAKLPGYALRREFYTPRYDVKNDDLTTNRPDFRTTLFWIPLILTDTNGKATVSFFTSDAKTEVRIRAEGATANGLPGVGKKRVRVE